ncbi:hypothetical protein GE061_010019 [Apolygus lucorum]|uniref:Peptidase S1 domain-containing protein n=1 Tax=Apolygus lucorum TaxID=248454 RepID=A0A8S9Y230_APOLU|nr:hypothetical protein GE061_010019 [Apolygus lucorum]
MWLVPAVWLTLQLLLASSEHAAHVFETSIKIRPLENKVFGSPTNYSQGDFVRIWKWSTQPNAALRLRCEIDIPETSGCANGSFMFFVNDQGRTFCGRTTTSTSYSGNRITVIYKKHNREYQLPLDYFHCSVDSKIIAKRGPVSYRPPSIDHQLNKIDDTYHGISPGLLATTCSCGWTNKRILNYNTGGRLVGGEEYTIHEYPFIVQLFSMASKHPFCAGTIISKHHVLTAAHCTIDYHKSPQRLGIGAGTYDNSVSSLTSSQLTTARKIIIHEEFKVSEYGLIHDISLVTLTTPFLVNMAVGPACFPGPQWDLTGHRVRILGWGAKAYKLKMNSRPQEVDMIVVDH